MCLWSTRCRITGPHTHAAAAACTFAYFCVSVRDIISARTCRLHRQRRGLLALLHVRGHATMPSDAALGERLNYIVFICDPALLTHPTGRRRSPRHCRSTCVRAKGEIHCCRAAPLHCCRSPPLRKLCSSTVFRTAPARNRADGSAFNIGGHSAALDHACTGEIHHAIKNPARAAAWLPDRRPAAPDGQPPRC